MGGAILCVYMAAGGWVCWKRRLHPSPILSAWLGSAMGLVAMCWLPAAFALLFGKLSLLCSLLGLGVWLAAVALITFLPRRGPFLPDTPPEKGVLQHLTAFTLPLLALTGVLFITHILLPGKGGLYGGQCTYGDLSMHMGIITSIAEQGTFPPMYSIFYGEKLGYPFLVNSLSASMLQLGDSLRLSIIFPSILMSALVFSGYWLFVYDATGRKRTATLSGLLFFIGGGLGFFYFLDGAAENPWNFTRIFTGYYNMPTNFLDWDLRWVNVIADMMIPQRTTLLGWAVLPAGLVLLRSAVRSNDRLRYLLSGLLIGSMPMMHTHSFVAAGFIGIGWALTEWPWRQGLRAWGRRAADWLAFLLPCALLAVPQLLVWIFPQSSHEGFIRLSVDWVNTRDPSPWFWVKNLGIPIVLLAPALYAGGNRVWKWYSGAAALWLVSMLVAFQPNPYDNNKLLLVWWMLSVVPVAAYMGIIWDRLKSLPGRAWLAAAVSVLLFTSGLLTLARELVSGGQYLLYGNDYVAASEYVKEHTEPDALFITGKQHLNPIAALAGRNIWVGSPSYLYYHGFDTEARNDQVTAIYTDTETALTLPAELGASYILVTDYERGNYPGCDDRLRECYPVFFRQGSVTIYSVTGSPPVK
ncbi:MAG: hypothetical protein ACOX17_09185 [Christensenellales bacterium]|jgi:hypothetical protein